MSDLTIFDHLRMPFPTTSISWRVGATTEKDGKLLGKPLAYIDARDVMDRLDGVLGPQAWQCRYSEQGAKTICEIGVNIGAADRTASLEWIWKADGAGDTDYEAEKGALSDAFKRAAVRWGVGRYLYDIKSGWVEVAKRGNTTFIPDESRAKLDKLHDDAVENWEWGDRSDRNAYRLVLAALMNLDTNLLETFEKDNAGVIATLPVAMRQNLSQKIGQMGAERAKREAA